VFFYFFLDLTVKLTAIQSNQNITYLSPGEHAYSWK